MAHIDRLADIGKVAFVETHCTTCGAVTPLPQGEGDTMCTFCEAYVPSSGKRLKADDPFIVAQEAIKKQDWLGAVKSLDPVIAGNDPVKLFGAASIYAAFSDAVYSDVNYNLSGFMEKNANNRNDEFNKNPNNSMHLISRAKEMLFDAIYIINTQTEIKDESTSYTEFMCEIKLNRFVQASKVLKRINDAKGKGLIWMYANMVYAVEVKAKSADELVGQLLARNEPNSLYYYARCQLDGRQLGEAARALSITKKMYMPSAMRLMQKVKNVEDATRL